MSEVDDNSYSIPHLMSDNTFLDWVNHYNAYAVNKLNNLEIYTGWSGDGIDVVVGSTGSMQVNLADVVSKGITFNDVTIDGDLKYNWDNSTVQGAKHRVFPQGGYTGISGGFTFGSSVRVNELAGDTEYFLAKADSKDFAEVFGIVSNRVLGSAPPYTIDNTYLEITTHGVVEGDFTNVTASGNGLSAGCVYFLSPGTSGGITPTEPVISGQVSKPVLIGITADKAMVLNYRGQYLQGSGTGGTGGIDNNKKILHVGSYPGSGVVRGDIVLNDTSADYNGWTAMNETNNDANAIVGLCVTSEFAADGQHYIEVVNSGFINEAPVPGAGILYYNTDTGVISNINTGNFFGVAWGTDPYQCIIAPSGSSTRSTGRSVIIDGVTYGSAINNNLLINGGFDIWQRSIGVDSAYGSTGSTYFADRWVRMDGTTGASYGTHSIQRKTFAANQTEVFGNPTYYATLQNTMSGGITAEYIHIENRIEDVRTLRDEEVTLSFYARAGSSGVTMDIAVTQYDGATTTTTYPETIQMGTVWSKYESTFTIPNITTTPTGDDYLGIGFRTELINTTYDIAKMKLERGDVATTNADIDETEELDKCKRYYQRTYDLDERTHSITMLDNNTPSISSMNFTITPEKDTYHTFDIPMRKTPSITLYSPSSGYTGDGFNKTANKDLRNTSGTYGWNNMPRLSPSGGSMIGADYINDEGMYITVPSGTVVFDNVSVHYVADSDLNENM